MVFQSIKGRSGRSKLIEKNPFLALGEGFLYNKGNCSFQHIDWIVQFPLWSLQGMILRLPDYESGALTN